MTPGKRWTVHNRAGNPFLTPANDEPVLIARVERPPVRACRGRETEQRAA